MKTYENGPYKVTIGFDGAINVKSDDWLTKYSAAIYDNFFNVFEYGRKDVSGNIKLVEKVDQIYTNETIYHLPTFDAAFIPKLDSIPIITQKREKRFSCPDINSRF